jgi:Protein of unknown function (DUF3829)
MHQSKRMIALLIGLSLLGAPGCRSLARLAAKKAVDKAVRDSNSAQARSGTGTSGGTAPPTSTKEDPDQAMSDKLNAYVNCFNATSSNVHRSEDRYTMWVKNTKTGPTGKESLVYGLYQITEYDIKKCTPLPAMAAKAPALPGLDAAAIAYAKAFDDVAPKINDAHKYYERSDYKDDKFAKAKAMHSALWSGFEAFDKASETFSVEIDKVNSVHQEEELTRLEKEVGKKLLWHKMTAGKKAKQILKFMGKDTFDVKEAERLVSEFTAHTDATIAYAAAHKKEQPTMWSTYESALKEFMDVSKERMRRVRDKTPYSRGDQMIPEHASGSAAKLSRVYNDFVNRGNGMNFPQP